MTPKVIIIRNLNGKEDEIMKTTRYFAIIACASAVAASCMKDELKDNVYVEPIFTAVREDFGGPASKTMLTDNYKVVWCSGDEVGVFDGSVYPRKGVGSGSQLVNKESGWEYGLRFKTTDNGASAGFGYEAYDAYKDEEPEVYAPGAADSYLLIHPMAVNFIANVSEGKFRAWLSNSQKAEAGTYDSARGFAVAKTSDLSEPVRFKNAVTLMEFVIPDSMSGKVKTIKVTPAGSNINIAGDLLIDYSGADVVTSPWGSTAGESKTPKTDVTLTPKSGTAFASGKYYMVVCPGTYDVITVEATLSSGVVLKRESSKGPYTFKPGYVYGMGNIDAAGGTFSGGVSELPYVFSLYATAGEGNDLKYVKSTAGAYSNNTKTFEHYYDDLDNGVRFHCKGAGRTSSDVRTSVFYSNTKGVDNIPAKSFVSQESAGDGYVESFYRLVMPLGTNLKNIQVTFGIETTGAAIRDWKIQYSKDDATWNDGGNFTIQSNGGYHIYNVAIDLESEFVAGEILYLKWIPTGKVRVSDHTTTTTGWGSDVRFWGGVVISDLSAESTSTDLGTIYFESFDEMTSGVDYLMGEKLGYLANCCGSVISSWTEQERNGVSGKNVAMRPGYVQIGTIATTQNYNAQVTVSAGTLTTPAFGQTGDMKLSFKAMAFRSYIAGRTGTTSNEGDADANSVVLSLNEGTFDDDTQTKTIEITSGSWGNVEDILIKGATENTCVTFTSPEGATYCRWFLDDICVTKAQ